MITRAKWAEIGKNIILAIELILMLAVVIAFK
jgi:hypothetical protein